MFEREPKAGGLLRYGIPDFKMEKRHIDRRVKQMEAEGVVFHYNQNIGVTKPVEELKAEYDAVIFCGGAEDPRNPNLPGQEFEGVHYAMPYLVQSNRRVGQEPMRGNGEAPIPDYTALALIPGQRLLICSDGLTKELTDIGIQHFLATQPTAEEAARTLVQQAVENAGRDNVTVIVIDVHAVGEDRTEEITM